MKFSTLNPQLRDNGKILLFDCPCGCHAVRLPISAESAHKNGGVWWIMTGELPNVTLRAPSGQGNSVNCSPCFHWTITNGECA